jgi:hypothetical protein
MPKHQSANAPRLAQVFWPERRQPSPPALRVARERMAARSLPASGSDQPWHQISSPAAIGGRNRSFWAGVPNSSRVGPSKKMPFWLTRLGAFAR